MSKQQATLFTGSDLLDTSRAAARRTDPATSRQAAERVERSGQGATNRQRILTAVQSHPGRTGAELAVIAGLERHEASRRLPELERAGLVRKGDPRPCTVRGTEQRTWFVNS